MQLTRLYHYVRFSETRFAACRSAAALILLACIGTAGCLGQSRDPGDSASGSYANNVEAMRAASHPIPPLETWWIAHPKPEEVAAALVPPANAQGAICIKRLWIPREIVPGVNVDEDAMKLLEPSPRGPHHLALLAHYYLAKGNPSKAEGLMAQAKKQFFQDPWKGYVYCGFRTREMFSALFALDWIQWQDKDEFEKAFQRMKEVLESGRGAVAPRESVFHSKDGSYWLNDCNIEHSNMIEELLTLSVYGVNDSGPSHRWAVERLPHLGNHPQRDPEALYSTFEYANVMSLLSRRGGGREFGQSTPFPAFGSYEAYFASSALIQLEAVDTATGRKWDLVDKSLYIRTRHVGLIFEQDATVAQAKILGQDEAICEILMKLCARQDAKAAGIYRWCLPGAKANPVFLEFRALAGIAPKATVPKAQPTSTRVGSRWHYREDPSRPDSTLRLWLANRDIDCFRIAPDERCMALAIGKVGLVDGQVNRSGVVGALANGVALYARGRNGEPQIATREFWGASATDHPFHSPDRPIDAKQVLNDPRYLVGTDGPTATGGIWRWTRDYTAALTQVEASGIAGKVRLAKFAFEFDPRLRRVEITDTIRADKEVYVGWHFSPTHLVKLIPNGFRFGDDKDEIRVTIEGLDGTELEVKRRTEWQQDGFTLPMEWNDQLRTSKRIAENVAYTPTTYRDEYRVRVIIEANPQ